MRNNIDASLSWHSFLKEASGQGKCINTLNAIFRPGSPCKDLRALIPVFRVLLLHKPTMEIPSLFPDGIPDGFTAIETPSTEHGLMELFARNPADHCVILQPANDEQFAIITAEHYSQQTYLRVYQAHRYNIYPCSGKTF